MKKKERKVASFQPTTELKMKMGTFSGSNLRDDKMRERYDDPASNASKLSTTTPKDPKQDLKQSEKPKSGSEDLKMPERKPDSESPAQRELREGEKLKEA
jgi:hypothetical protein